ncbi:hypothetical protein NA57DRAFT_54139 [Rhizodiscina lignyota]|uniref:HAM1-like N-terminal domain-containing protein n=1 Tax=Rhizodiscina lignyota TaxID=1504668 RepID=A0A9P4IM05_9PEZI|nr:hypothetical protein NA57DRAFT_54139 [Rhizodiscina lignyota]
MSSCFGFRKSRQDDTAPLLPKYRDDTALQVELHKKLHTYQMIRALGKGFMPSNEQLIVNLRTVVAADVLNPDNPDLSDSGRLLVKYTKQWLTHFMELLQHKNYDDEVQDFIWFLTKSRISIDTEDIAKRASKAKAKADTVAAYKSLQTVGSLLLTNSDFRLFVSDLNTLGREVFRDTAFTLSSVAESAGKTIEPPKEEQEALKHPGQDAANGVPSKEDVQAEAEEISQAVAHGAEEVAKSAAQSAAEKLKGDEGETLVERLKKAIVNLRKRPDYNDSVSTLSLLIKRYAMVYSRALEETLETADQDIHQNPETDRAVRNFWSFITSFGDKEAWNELEKRFKQVLSHKDHDPDFENLMTQTGDSLQSMLTDPSFFDSNNANEKFKELREKSRQVGTESSLRSDIDALLDQAHTTFKSVLHDKDIANLITTSTRIVSILSPKGQYTNADLFTDALNVFVPLLIAGIQYVPIPRLEVSTPDLDLLLENLIVEPGRTVNASSFLPYKLRIETRNDLEIRKARFRTTSHVSSLVTLKLDGLSLRADDVGFWLRAHSGIFRLADEGIASFALDERGIDIHMDIEVGRERLEKILTLKAVRVHVHKLTYQLRKSKFSWLTWIIKPLLRPILRKVMEKQLASAIADLLHAANRELLFARERLRATRIADPQDLLTFLKAVAARLTPEEDPDLYTRVGIKDPGRGVFKGVYAPGSIVKVWTEEGARAAERIEDYERDGWRNDVFEIHTQNMV